MSSTKNLECSSRLHFKIHRLIEYVKFYPQYIRCKLFHEQSFPSWESWKGAILCTCGLGIDLGYSYAQHCEGCYNLARKDMENRK